MALLGRTFDTWALSYERDGVNQNGNAIADEGTNGFDDDNLNGVDDPGERETIPPYPAALRHSGQAADVRADDPPGPAGDGGLGLHFGMMHVIRLRAPLGHRIVAESVGCGPLHSPFQPADRD